MIIKVDIDGVIRDIITPMCELYNDLFGTDIKPEDVTDYDVNVSFPLLRKMYNCSANKYFFQHQGKRIFFEKARLIENVRETLNQLLYRGHTVIIVSWQESLHNKLDTLKFLDSNMINYSSICFTKDKHLVKGDYLIDDNPEFLKKEPKCKRIIMDAPYNRYYKNVYLRLNNLSEILDILK